MCKRNRDSLLAYVVKKQIEAMVLLSNGIKENEETLPIVKKRIRGMVFLTDKIAVKRIEQPIGIYREKRNKKNMNSRWKLRKEGFC